MSFYFNLVSVLRQLVSELVSILTVDGTVNNTNTRNGGGRGEDALWQAVNELTAKADRTSIVLEELRVAIAGLGRNTEENREERHNVYQRAGHEGYRHHQR